MSLVVTGLILYRNELSEEHSAQLLSTLIVRPQTPSTVEADVFIAPSSVAAVLFDSSAQSQLNVSSVFHQTHLSVEPVPPKPCRIVCDTTAGIR